MAADRFGVEQCDQRLPGQCGCGHLPRRSECVQPLAQAAQLYGDAITRRGTKGTHAAPRGGAGIVRAWWSMLRSKHRICGDDFSSSFVASNAVQPCYSQRRLRHSLHGQDRRHGGSQSANFIAYCGAELCGDARWISTEILRCRARCDCCVPRQTVDCVNQKRGCLKIQSWH
jgi:hypothetical protein